MRQREGGEEEERRSSAHDYAIISLCRHTHEFLALQLLQVAVASSVEFSASAATFAHAQSIFQSFSLIIRQCSAGRKGRRSAVNLLCLTLLLCHCSASSYCAAFAAAPFALLSFFAAQPSPLPAMCSSAVAALRRSLPLSHQHPLFALRCRSLIMFCCCCSRLVPCCCAAAVAASASALSLPLSLSSLWQFRARSFDLAPACLVPLCTAPVVCIQISLLSLPLFLPPFRCLCCR